MTPSQLTCYHTFHQDIHQMPLCTSCGVSYEELKAYTISGRGASSRSDSRYCGFDPRPLKFPDYQVGISKGALAGTTGTLSFARKQDAEISAVLGIPPAP